jgi:hypothetical protein
LTVTVTLATVSRTGPHALQLDLSTFPRTSMNWCLREKQ